MSPSICVEPRKCLKLLLNFVPLNCISLRNFFLALFDFLYSQFSRNVHCHIFLSFRHYSTVRNSREIVRKWRHELPFHLADQIQSNCLTVMNILGYKLASDPNTLTNKSIPLLLQQNHLPFQWIKNFMLRV